MMTWWMAWIKRIFRTIEWGCLILGGGIIPVVPHRNPQQNAKKHQQDPQRKTTVELYLYIRLHFCVCVGGGYAIMINYGGFPHLTPKAIRLTCGYQRRDYPQKHP